ncbi:glycoside hydrolase family 43 protein [Draconibacterium orientale]|uniref:glycoside hydrolase family 43 protein n=1 Tax=Draconibacterium orientale TaxID=1168034 RepID=UPI0029BFEAE0|nr:glycoside hydrolase family 43 protein [Draconibacterium orientale]
MKNTILIITVMFHFTFCAQPEKKKETAYYQNPVIAGDFPDPSVIRVGDTYYAAGTSCDFAPNYPLFESKDLINWKRIGSVFNEPPAWTADDFWAPELFYHNGTFFVYYTTKRKDNRIACIGVATTKDISKGFTDHGILIEWGEEAIDAFVFQDDDEKLYITWKAYGLTPGRDIEILCSELSDDGMQLVGDHFTLTDFTKGWQGAGDEGQCIVKRNGWYYMFYSVGGCCDNRCDYRVRVARSKNLRNGWEQFPEPILQGGDEWRCTGHGTLVTTPDNRYFYMYHSYNATDFEFIGRQGMLDEMLWNNETNWPYFKGDTASVSAPVPFENTVQETDPVFEDDFSNDKNLPFFEWDVKGVKLESEIADGELLISPQEGGIAFLGLRPQSGNYELISEAISTDQRSGIGIYSNQNCFLCLAASESQLLLVQKNNGEEQVLVEVKLDNPASVFLKYEAVTGRYFHFFWSENGEDWIPVEVDGQQQIDGTFLAQWGFSPRVGFIVNGNGKNVFRFSSLKVNYYFN